MFDWFLKKRERLPLPYKQELHCHLIPGVDDGSRSIDLSLSMIKSLHEFGVERFIFTPHRTDVTFENSVETINPVYEQLVEALKQSGADIPTSYSFEYRMDEGFLNMLNKSKYGESDAVLKPLHGPYILVENAFSRPLHGLDQLLFDLQCRGYLPILAHPERYLYYAGHGGERYEHLLDQQVEFQCNILSFAGHYGPVQKKMAYWMLENGYVKYLGSDMHHPQHVKLIDSFLRSKEYASIYEDLKASINNDFTER